MSSQSARRGNRLTARSTVVQPLVRVVIDHHLPSASLLPSCFGHNTASPLATRRPPSPRPCSASEQRIHVPRHYSWPLVACPPILFPAVSRSDATAACSFMWTRRTRSRDCGLTGRSTQRCLQTSPRHHCKRRPVPALIRATTETGRRRGDTGLGPTWFVPSPSVAPLSHY